MSVPETSSPGAEKEPEPALTVVFTRGGDKNCCHQIQFEHFLDPEGTFVKTCFLLEVVEITGLRHWHGGWYSTCSSLDPYELDK